MLSAKPETPEIWIRQKAEELGFGLVGFAKVAPSQTIGIYQDWLRQGYAGAMEYLERHAELKEDPRHLLPEAQTLIALGMHYQTDDPDPVQSNNPALGRVSRYAWGDDYHQVLRAKLRELSDGIQQKFRVGDGQHRPCVDTGPLLERELAHHAGLGWFGKHSNLIHWPQGSWFFLAELLVDFPLTPDAPFTRVDCGSCTRCIEACPTDAIVADRTVDARRCISYLTIELKGAIPQELRTRMGNWIFGCDICQEVCPWNRNAPRTSEPAFQPRSGFQHPELVEWMEMNQEEFHRRFRKSPLKRTQRRGLLRNIAVALGNWGSPKAIPALGKGLRDTEPLVRQHAAWALGRIAAPESQRLLQHSLVAETDEAVRREIRGSLNPHESANRLDSASDFSENY